MLLLVNKPRGLTSHDVVNQVRRITGERRVGHAGTLDPLADGLLIVAVGRAETKKISQFVGLPKTYEFTVRLGVCSRTQDLEGPIEYKTEIRNPKFEIQETENILKSFLGKQEQRIPAYSAKKVDGKKMYELARKGKEIPQLWHEIEIFEIELLESGVSPFIVPTPEVSLSSASGVTQRKMEGEKRSVPYLKIRAHVSSGTYIRQLSEDIAAQMGTWGLAERITRTAIGEYQLKDAKTLEELKEAGGTR